jgi:hypothetical protein
VNRIVLAVLILMPLAGCFYDYAQHSDRVAYSAGDAVKANLERETANPSKKSMSDVSGLGQDGEVAIQTDDDTPTQ